MKTALFFICMPSAIHGINHPTPLAQTQQQPAIVLINDSDDNDAYVVEDTEDCFALRKNDAVDLDPNHHNYSLLFHHNRWCKITYSHLHLNPQIVCISQLMNREEIEI